MKKTKFLFDAPVSKDWLFFLFLFILGVNLISGFSNVTSSGGLSSSSSGLISGLIDGAFRVMLSWFPLVPVIYLARRQIRKRQPDNQYSDKHTHKVCTVCSEKIPVDWGHCNKCLSTRFRKIEDKDLILTNDLTQIKVCDKCKSEVHVFYPKCFQCAGTTFTHKQVKNKKQSFLVSSEEAMSDSFPELRTEPSKILNPELKTCPMCAEDIKFAAKKCRYCQHMLDT